MIARRRWVTIGVMCGLLALSGATAAAARKSPQVTTGTAPAAPAPVLQPWEVIQERIDHDPRSRVWSRPLVRIGQDYVLDGADTVRDAVVVFGSATINGFVNGDVTVVLGDVRITDSAVINGSLVVIGGNLTASAGALVRRDLLVVGGLLNTPPSFAPGGEHIVVGAPAFGDRLRAVVPWITRGLLWGRLLVPGVAWVWWLAATALLIYFLINAVFHEPVTESAQVLATRPLNSFMTGLVTLLIVGPLTILLLVSVVGALVLPFVLCALVVAGVIGKTGVARAIGASVVRQNDPYDRLASARSFLIGAIVIVLLYLVPVLGMATWALTGVFGLGAAVLAFFAALKRERPAIARDPEIPAVPPTPVHPETPRPTTGDSLGPVPLTTASAVHADAADAPPSWTPPPSAPRPASAGAETAIPADLRAFPHATFSDRLAAFVLDLLLVLIVTMWLEQDRYGHNNRFLVYALVYFVGFWTWKGTTVGGIICNLRVVRVDGSALRFVDGLVRGLSGIFSIAALGLGGFWILRDPEQQAWHDRIAGTYVVKVPHGWPVP